jgi:hypothetical protein
MESSWHLHCENPKAIEAFYETPPTLDDFDVHEVSLMRDGPSLTYAGDLSRFADRPSQRWDASANRVRLILSLWNISNLSLTGWATTNIGALKLAPGTDSSLSFTFRSDSFSCSGNCEFAMIDQVRAYTDGEH